MPRRGDSRSEIFAVQSDLEEESAIETVLTDAEEHGPIAEAEDLVEEREVLVEENSRDLNRVGNVY